MTVRAVLAALMLGAAVIGQDPVAAFDRAYAAAEAARAAGGAAGGELAEAYRDALTAFLKIPTDSPDYGPRVPAGAFAAQSSGDLELAVELYEDALRRHPDDARLVEWALRALLAQAGPDAALDRAVALRATAPAGVAAFVLAARGIAGGALFEAAARRLRNGDREAGLLPFELAAEATGHPIDQANLALSLRFLGDLEGALALYREALEATPEDPVLWNDFGLCLKAAGQLEDAIAAFRSSIEHEASLGDGPGWTNLALLARRDVPSALPDLLDALRNVLRPRPDQAMCRRMMVDAAVDRAARAAGRPARHTRRP